MGAFIDHAADGVRIVLGLDPVEDHVGHGDLAGLGLGTGLEIDGAGKAVLLGEAEVTLLEDALLFLAGELEAVLKLGNLGRGGKACWTCWGSAMAISSLMKSDLPMLATRIWPSSGITRKSWRTGSSSSEPLAAMAVAGDITSAHWADGCVCATEAVARLIWWPAKATAPTKAMPARENVTISDRVID